MLLPVLRLGMEARRHAQLRIRQTARLIAVEEVLGQPLLNHGAFCLFLEYSPAAWLCDPDLFPGIGMALLYPNLSAAVADTDHPAWRGSAIGIYRFWRDLGYGIGALGLVLAAHFSGQMETAFWFVALSTLISGVLLAGFGEETHPRIDPSNTVVESWPLEWMTANGRSVALTCKEPVTLLTVATSMHGRRNKSLRFPAAMWRLNEVVPPGRSFK